MKKQFYTLVMLLLLSTAGFAQFKLTAIVPASTNFCYASGNFNSWAADASQMTFVSKNGDGTKTFSLNLQLTFLNSGTFKILSGPDWADGQVDEQFVSVLDGTSQVVTVTGFLAIFGATAINDVTDKGYSIGSENKSIKVQGKYSNISIFDPNGRLVDSSALTSTFISKTLNQGLYIIRIDSKSYKQIIN